MADISTAVSMARVPILGENGRISDDYIPAAIGEGVESAEAAATRAETAATAAESSASAASQSAAQASGSASAASASATQAQQSATTAGGAATSAQSAQTAAEAAKTAAAGSAQDAQQSATAAAESAASVADKFITSAVATTLEPGSQATASVENQVLTIGVPKGDKGDKGEKGDTGTGVPDGGTPGQLLSKTEDGTAWVDPPSTGNVLTGTATGYVAHAEDAYSAKPREVRIKGRTVQNLWVNPSGTMRGVTVTSNADGSMTISGSTSGNDATIYAPNSYVLKPNTTYTVSCDKKIGAAVGISCFTITEHDSDGSQLTYHDFAYSDDSKPTTVTFTTQANAAYYRFRMYAGRNTTVSGTYRIMLNEGSTAQPWCPPGLNGVKELSVVTAGKNLLKINSDLQAKTINGLTFTPNKDGTVTVNGTATGDSDYYLLGTSWNAGADNYLPVQEMVFSSNGAAKLYGFDSSGSTSFGVVLNGGNQIISAEQIIKTEKIVCFLSYGSGHGETNKRVYVQLELGSTATAYEPPNVTSTPIDLDGHTLNSLPNGTCDELRIGADGTCEVERKSIKTTFDGGEDEGWVLITADNGHGIANFRIESGNYATSGSSAICDTLPIDRAIQVNATSAGILIADSSLYLRLPSTTADTVKELRTWLEAHPTTVVFTNSSIGGTEPLNSVTLPTLPAPNITVYNDSDVPSDITLEYERDVTIAFGKLAKQIAGTASAVAVREASTIEEE